MKKHITIIILAVVIVAVLIVNMCSFTVRWQEQALVMTFDKMNKVYNATGQEAGWHGKWPWQKVVSFDTRIRTLQRQATETKTRDEQNIIVTIYINWRISDAEVFYKRFRKDDDSAAGILFEAEDNLMKLMGDTKLIFSEYNFSDLVTLDKEKFRLTHLESDREGGMLYLIRQAVSARGSYGVEILDVGIKQLGVPDSVTQPVFERMTTERQEQITKLVTEGESQANSIRSKAESEATQLRAQAEAKARDIKGKGDAKAAREYAKFMEYPKLALFLRKLETLRHTLGKQTTIVIDSGSAAYELLRKGPDVIEKKP